MPKAVGMIPSTTQKRSSDGRDSKIVTDAHGDRVHGKPSVWREHAFCVTSLCLVALSIKENKHTQVFSLETFTRRNQEIKVRGSGESGLREGVGAG